MSLSTYPVLGYHGCDAETADAIISGRTEFGQSTNAYDWLGKGTYFWVGSYNRALDWAEFKKTRFEVTTPAVVCAVIELRLCLNLTDFGASKSLADSYADLKAKMAVLGEDVPSNSDVRRFGTPFFRNRDCAVIQHLHQRRAAQNERPYDTVIGAFEEGQIAFEGGAIREQTHIQLAVRTPECIIKTFRR